jgi:hypothetical protein
MREVINDVENAKPVAVGQLIADEVYRPAGIRSWLERRRSTCSERFAAMFASLHAQSFLAIQPVDAIADGRFAFAAKQDKQTPVTEAPTLIGQFT